MTPYWTQAIAEAKGRKARGEVGFYREHGSRASRWVTCACGEQDSRVPRRDRGAPRDDGMRSLGHDFYDAVRADDPEQAERVLAKIERLATVILREVASEATS